MYVLRPYWVFMWLYYDNFWEISTSRESRDVRASDDVDGPVDGPGDVARVRDPSRERVRCGKTPIGGERVVVERVVERGETGDFCASR